MTLSPKLQRAAEKIWPLVLVVFLPFVWKKVWQELRAKS
jgi:hypothetical protein